MLGAAVCYLFRKTDAVETIDDVLFGRVKRLMTALGVTFLPTLMCGTVLGNSSRVNVDLELSDEQQRLVMGRLVDAIEREAESQGVRASFLHVLDSEGLLEDALRKRRYLRSLDIPFSVLDIRWKSYQEYLEHLPGKRRGVFRRQARRNRASGVVISSGEELTGMERDIEELANLNSLKHNGRRFAFRDGTVAALKRNLGTQARIHRASKGGQTTGMCLTIQSKTVSFVTVIGVEQSARKDFTYFEVCYSAVISDAISQGLHQIHYGRSMYELKRRRGCHLVEAHNYCRPVGWRRHTTRPWLALLSAWNKRILRREPYSTTGKPRSRIRALVSKSRPRKLR